jgi:c-di-GMP-binding flagellar brake protein YcgR
MDLSILETKKIKIEVLDDRLNRDWGNHFASEVLNVLENQKMEIGVPVIRGYHYFLPLGVKLNIFYNPQDTNKSDFIVLPAVILGVQKEETIPYFTVKITGDSYKTQRRKFFRLVGAPSLTEDVQINDGREDARFSVLDLSASGAKIASNKEFKKGQIIKLKINLDVQESIHVKGKVVRVFKSDEKYKSQKFEMGIDFIELVPYEQDAIVRYVVKKQRRMLYFRKK